MPTTRLHNNKVSFSIITKNDVEFLICTSITGSQRVRYVENLRTGKKAFPTIEQVRSVSDDSVPFPTTNLDKLVDLLIDQVA